MKLFILFIALIITGCSSTTNPRSRAENKQWRNAYDGVDYILSKNIKEDTERMILLVNEYPEIVNYGYSTFTVNSLIYWSDRTGDLYYKRIELERFCIISTIQQCNQAIDNLLSVEKTIKKELRLLKDLYSKLTEKEQKSLKDNYKIIFYESSEIGIVTDRQVQNLSTPGSNAGAEIGGAVGATAYISNATPSSYSMKSDLTSTVLGALAGAVLLNKSPTEQYVIRYSLKLRNGEIRQVDQVSSTPLGQSIGMCVFASNATPIDQSFCTMTLAEFRAKYAGEIKSL